VALAQKAGYTSAGAHVEIRPAGPNDAEIILEKEHSTADPGEFIKSTPTPAEHAAPAEMVAPECTPDNAGAKPKLDLPGGRLNRNTPNLATSPWQ
jgi:hypothetical protein